MIDRLEDDLAVVEVEGGAVLDLPRWLLPRSAGEGDVIRVRTEPGAEGEQRCVFYLDPEATRAAREAAAARLDRLRARDPGGDIEL